MYSDKKYQNDPTFRNLVDQMLFQVRQLNTSFSEIREAVLFAQLKYEMSAVPRPIVYSPELQYHLLNSMGTLSSVDKKKS